MGCLHRSFFQLRKHVLDTHEMVIENFHGNVEHAKDCLVGHGVEDARSILPAHHDAATPQHRKLLRDRGLLDTQSTAQLVDRNFATPECVQNTNAQRVGERLEELGLKLTDFWQYIPPT